jgi:hypothetical protein
MIEATSERCRLFFLFGDVIVVVSKTWLIGSVPNILLTEL